MGGHLHAELVRPSEQFVFVNQCPKKAEFVRGRESVVLSDGLCFFKDEMRVERERVLDVLIGVDMVLLDRW